MLALYLFLRVWPEGPPIQVGEAGRGYTHDNRGAYCPVPLSSQHVRKAIRTQMNGDEIAGHIVSEGGVCLPAQSDVQAQSQELLVLIETSHCGDRTGRRTLA